MALDNNMKNKSLVWEFHNRLANSNALGINDIFKDYLDDDLMWHGPQPINDLTGREAVLQNFFKPFVDAFPNFERHHNIFLGNTFKGDQWVSSMGHYVANFENDWLGIPATGKLVAIRFGEFCRIEDGKIKEIFLMLDLLDLMRQVDTWPLSKSLGVEGWWPKPASYNGIITSTQDAMETRKTLKLVAAWVDAVKHFDQNVINLEMLRHDDYFHPKYSRYCSSGIGATRGFSDFKNNFQQPYITAFKERKFANHQVRIAEGSYLAASGWENLQGRHIEEFLGVPASNAQVKIRAMEWWRRDGATLKESWIMIDMIDLFLQIGEDMFEKLRKSLDKQEWF